MALSRKIRLLIPVGIVLLLIGLCVLSLATIDSVFVTKKLAEQIEKGAEAKTEIERAEIRPFVGEVSLEGVRISKKEKGTSFEFVTDHIEAKVSVKKLIFRQIDLVKVHVEKPRVSIVRTDREIPKGEDLPALTDLLPEQFKKLTTPNPMEEKRDREFDFVIHDLSIKDGTFTYKELRKGVESTFALEDLKYHATDVSISRFYRLLLGADIEGDLSAGAIKGSFKKVHAPGASSVSVSRLDMKSLNSTFLPTDAFVINSGVMDASAQLLTGGEALITIKVSGLTIEKNPNSRSKTFFLLPVGEVVKYVNRKGGDFNLTLKLSGCGWHTSEDLDELIAGFWKDFWANILEGAVSGVSEWLRDKLSH